MSGFFSAVISTLWQSNVVDDTIDESACFSNDNAVEKKYDDELDDEPVQREFNSAGTQKFFEWQVPDFDMNWISLDELTEYLDDFCSGCRDQDHKGYALSKVHGHKDTVGMKHVDFMCDRGGTYKKSNKDRALFEIVKGRNSRSKKCDCKVAFHSYRDDNDGGRWKLQAKVSVKQ